MNLPRRTPKPTARLHLAPLVLPLLVMLVALPSHAQYKVVGPDGKVTYTDRPPATTEGKTTPLNSRGGTASSDAALPIELRQVAARYPVTLYSGTDGCEPCNGARQFLRQRGIPYAEKQIQSPEDTQALQRIAGSTDIPTLTIGGQVLRGLAPDVWSSYLDAAGYPRESRLPASYQYATATPIVERRDATSVVPPPAAPAPTRPAEPAVANPSGIKF
jgi:glutaredoxin